MSNMDDLSSMLNDLEEEFDMELIALCFMELEDKYKEHKGYAKAKMILKQVYKFGNLSNYKLRLIKESLGLYKH